ncbi:hypothetical protein AVEN_139838-1 [Araneus ventricosus]|uniref:Integrase catalytic domain-containing protein n=1 Tax=Araneus ventricosus TaxID=182803 RepID=A0A4Y2G0Y0_ARAVE|nr:hypothetical protein AVEN_139838-1 [Araneus ventricosus]
MRKLNFISQFTTNIVHIPDPENVAADVMSRVSAITFPSKIVYVAIAEAQNTNQELSRLMASQISLQFKKVTLLNSRLIPGPSIRVLTVWCSQQNVRCPKSRITGYHPQANGMVEELQRPLKSSVKCHATESWTEVQPIILLGLRASLKEDAQCTLAELVSGTAVRLPGEKFDV